MKCVIFAGGKGNRIRTYNDDTPKPLITIGDEPIIWHIMRIYYSFGIKEFVICLGYKQERFKQYFLDMFNYKKDFELSFGENKIEILKDYMEDIKVSLIDTGLETQTGGRLKRVEEYLGDEDMFLLTYGDAVSDIDINDLIEFHKRNNKKVTITTVRKKERFGIIDIDNNSVITSFREKPDKEANNINAGFMVVNKEVLNDLNEDSLSFEKEILERYGNIGEVAAYVHDGFWQCMDYQSEREYLNNLIKENNAPWIRWEK